MEHDPLYAVRLPALQHHLQTVNRPLGSPLMNRNRYSPVYNGYTCDSLRVSQTTVRCGAGKERGSTNALNRCSVMRKVDVGSQAMTGQTESSLSIGSAYNVLSSHTVHGC